MNQKCDIIVVKVRQRRYGIIEISVVLTKNASLLRDDVINEVRRGNSKIVVHVESNSDFEFLKNSSKEGQISSIFRNDYLEASRVILADIEPKNEGEIIGYEPGIRYNDNQHDSIYISFLVQDHNYQAFEGIVIDEDDYDEWTRKGKYYN